VGTADWLGRTQHRHYPIRNEGATRTGSRGHSRGRPPVGLVEHGQTDRTYALGGSDRRHPRDRLWPAHWPTHAGCTEIASGSARRQHQRASILEVLHGDHPAVVLGDFVLRLGSVLGDPVSV